MARIAGLLVALALLVGCKAAPAKFTSARFQFTYSATQGLRLVDGDELKMKGGDNDHEAFLFAVRDGFGQNGFMAIAEQMAPRMNPEDGTSRPGIKDGSAFLDVVSGSYERDAQYRETGRTHVVTASGFVFDELDYRFGEEYDAAVVTPIGDGYLLVARCRATSAAELGKQTDSLHGLQKAP